MQIDANLSRCTLPYRTYLDHPSLNVNNVFSFDSLKVKICLRDNQIDPQALIVYQGLIEWRTTEACECTTKSSYRIDWHISNNSFYC